MWTKLASHTYEGITVGINRDFRKGVPVYSVKFGVLALDANGKEGLSPHVPFTPETTMTIAELSYTAQATIVADSRAVAEAEADRVKNLSTPPKSNPLDRKGLKQIGKTTKKKAKLQARGA